MGRHLTHVGLETIRFLTTNGVESLLTKWPREPERIHERKDKWGIPGT